MSLPFLHIDIDRHSKISLFRQVYEKIRDDILLKKLIPGTRLPATRTLAKELGLSRNVVMDAYDQLHAEGYIQSRAGSYTRVCDNTHYRAYQQPQAENKQADGPSSGADITFKTGVPDLSLFPRAQWGKYLKQAVEGATLDDLAYYRPEGHMGFRLVLTDYLYRARGIQVNPDQVVITSGATQALHLAAQVLFQPGGQAVIEDPGGYGVLGILRTAGYGFTPVENSGNGLDTSLLDMDEKTRLVYVTPSHQFPMGNIMPAAVRIQLLKAVADRDVYIVEDDYDSEFRYCGAPIHPFKALAPEKVIYIGSFSKVLSPALRIGYAIVPEQLRERFKALKGFSDAGSPLVDQIALQNFIRDGGFERHIFRMKKVYREKRDVLVRALKKAFGDSVHIFGENAGLHLVARFQGRQFHSDTNFNTGQHRILIQSVEKHTIVKGRHQDKLLFGYGHLTCDEIIQGIRALQRFILTPEVRKECQGRQR